MTATPDARAEATSSVALAVNRFGLGMRPDEQLPTDPKAWLLAQFERHEARPAAWAGEPSAAALLTDYLDTLRAARGNDEPGVRMRLRKQAQQRYRDAVNARVDSALTTAAPFGERLVHFWSNHFAVSVDKNPLALVAGAFELEAIRPHVFGRFEDMLLAVERHPAMLLFLDQARSVGPDSLLAQRDAMRRPDRKRGLNENLAREILELHTLGVRTGYSQADVIEFARALTGWSLGGARRVPGETAASGEFAFRPALHEPGVRTVLGRRYAQTGEAQARAILHDLALAPATATHLATKLARHFVADAPPPALVQRLADAYTASGGDLPALYRALIDAPETWHAAQPKFKTPWEWSVSLLRGLSRREPPPQAAALLAQLGQPVWRPGSPAGFDDTTDAWAAPDSLMRRVEVAQRLATRVDAGLDARTLGPRLLPAGLSENTARSIARAESASTALALLLVSPEFLRR